MALFQSLTGITDFINMVISIWLGLYLTTRVRANRIAFRIIVIMLALGGYYFIKIMSATGAAIAGEGLLIVLAIVAAENMTFSMLPDRLGKQLAWQTRLIILLGVLTMISQIAFMRPAVDDPFTISVPALFSVDGLVGAFEVLACLATLRNLFLIYRSNVLEFNREFIAGLAIGAGTIAYALAGFLLQVELPRFISNILMLVSLAMMGYSFAKHQLFIERRILENDLPVSVISMAGLLLVYLFAAGGNELSPTTAASISILVIASHIYYGWLRERFQRRLNRNSMRYERVIRQMAQKSARNEGPQRNMLRSLVLLINHMDAQNGFLAVRRQGEYIIEVTLDSLEPGTELQVDPEEISRPIPARGKLRGKVAWLVPGYYRDEPVVLLGLGVRTGFRDYTISDLDWTQVVANHYAAMVAALDRGRAVGDTIRDSHAGPDPIPEVEQLMQAVTMRPPSEIVKLVEQGFKYLNDFIRLGRSPLVDELGVEGNTHIERGKALQSRLVAVLETLRPEGELPKEPIPAEWRKYLILHDAYVVQDQHRNIMGKLYISDSTFYRDRRDAIHGVASALFENIARG